MPGGVVQPVCPLSRGLCNRQGECVGEKKRKKMHPGSEERERETGRHILKVYKKMHDSVH